MAADDSAAADTSPVDLPGADQAIVDLSTLDRSSPDQSQPDKAVLDQSPPDKAALDQSPTDQAMTDLNPPDQAVPDLPQPDLPVPDGPVPDQTPPDFTPSDLPLGDLPGGPDACQPTTCASKNYNCGTIFTGCGGVENCGTCTLPATCNGGGSFNRCGCPSGWKTETAVNATDSGMHTSITADGSGGIHVAYFYKNSGDLMYAYRSPAGAWSTMIADSTNYTGNFTDIDVDSGGGVHISYWDDTAKQVKYAYRKKGASSFTTSIVDPVSGGYPGSNDDRTSIKVDASGVRHMGYAVSEVPAKFSAARYVWYARSTDGITWTREGVATHNYNGGAQIGLDLDSAGGVYMSWGDNSNLWAVVLKYGYRKPAGGWTVTSVDASNSKSGLNASLAVDIAGGVHIAYRDYGLNSYKYAYKPAAGAFTTSVLDPGVSCGSYANTDSYTSIDTDKLGGVHAAYFNFGGKSLRYAYKALGMAWAYTKVYTYTNYVGTYADIVVEPQGHVSIACRSYPGVLVYSRLLKCAP